MRLISYLAIASMIFMVSCSGDSTPGSSDSSNGFVITLNFPDEYTVDRTTGAITGPSCDTCGTAPDYVTSVTVTLSSTGNPDLVYDLALDTGEVGGTVTPGDYIFIISVATNIGLTFTGSTTATLSAGTYTEIVIDLSVNAAPTDIVCTASDYTPAIGQGVVITCTGTDPDGDTLTFSYSDGRGWTATGGSGDSVNYTAN
jgi:hypothetical protein